MVTQDIISHVHCGIVHNPKEINKHMALQDYDWKGLISAEQIISISYISTQCYLVCWKGA